MKAVVLEKFGGPEVLEIKSVPDPVPGDYEILVRVKSSGLNRADVLQRRGKYPAPAGAPQQIPGLEFAGEVAQLGPKASRWRVGERVFGIVAGGAHAEFLVTDERAAAEIPENLDWDQAGAVPEAFITAHDALFTQAQLKKGETVLIHAVGSGVGLAGAQLGSACEAKVFGTSRTQDKLEKAKHYGMTDGTVVRDELGEIASKVNQWTAKHGADVVLDLVGGAYVPASIEAMALKGRLMLVGTVAGGKAEIPLGQVLSKRLKLIGTVLRARSIEEKIAATEAFANDVLPLLAKGTVRPVVDSVFPLGEVQAAHRKMESDATFGKVVLKID